MSKASRVEFDRFSLDEKDIADDPFKQLTNWWQEAVSANVMLIDAVHLATVDEQNTPDARIVLLKDFDAEGLVFFTNYESRKGEQLAHNPSAALTIFWPELERQIRVRGRVVKTSRAESEKYFASRPKGAQISAWASEQSHVVQNRAELEKRYADQSAKFLDQEIPCPPQWGGFRLVPVYFEFWQGRGNRLHDRFCFSRKDSAWLRQRLAP